MTHLIRSMTRTSIALIASIACLNPAAAQTRADSAGIREAALNYIEGWYSADSSRMAQALHPELTKRIVLRDDGGWELIRGTGATELIASTARGGGSEIPADRRRTDVDILDIFGNAASARIDAGGWIDYLHLAKWQGRWVIVNVLWELRQPS